MTLTVPRALAAQAPQSSSPVIDSIVVITHDVFDSAEAEVNPGFKAANAIHFRTRPYVVRRELLFKAGESLDTARIFESERNLRRMGLFRDVAIDTFSASGRLVARVQTADGWSTSLGLNARSTGGVFTWSTALTELNFLGTGDQVSIGYRKDVDRTAFTGDVGKRRLFGTKVQVTGSYDALSDGYDAGWSVGVPFRSLSQRRSLQVGGEFARRRILQFRDGVLRETYQQRTFRAGLLGAIAAHAEPSGYLRIWLRGQIKNEEYVLARDTLLAVPDTVSGAAGLFGEWRKARFTVVTHYNGFARDEDVDLSQVVWLGAWVAPGAFGYARAGVGPLVELQTGWPLGQSFIRFSAHANGLFTSAGLDSGRVIGTFTAAARLIPRQATILHAQVGSQRSPTPGREWDLGHGIGPRSFGPHAFSGTRMVWGTLEHRVFAWDELLGLFGLGFAAFVDYGGAWYPDEGARRGGNVGFGLRLGATRATGNNVGRFDLAYRFGDGVAGSRWVFSFGRSFNY